MIRLDDPDAAFVEGVRRALDRNKSERHLPTQDELDLFLLGGTVPARPIPWPKVDCPDCEATGKTCTCHGLPPFEHGHRPFETCQCVLRGRR